MKGCPSRRSCSRTPWWPCTRRPRISMRSLMTSPSRLIVDAEHRRAVVQPQPPAVAATPEDVRRHDFGALAEGAVGLGDRGEDVLLAGHDGEVAVERHLDA